MCGCIIERRQCLIRIAVIFLEMSTVSAKSLSCWGFDDVGSWFSACLPDSCWSLLPRIMILYSHQLPCVRSFACWSCCFFF